MAVDNPREHWRVGGVVVSFVTTPQPAPVVGETVDLTALFRQEAGESRLEYRDRHAELLAYAPRAGQYALHEPMGGGIRYTETHDGNVPGGSLLVAVAPPDADADTHAGRGYWALVESVTDATNVSQTAWALELSLVRLAPLADYADATAVSDALENEGI